jgi:hypothetical protein
MDAEVFLRSKTIEDNRFTLLRSKLPQKLGVEDASRGVL